MTVTKTSLVAPVGSTLYTVTQTDGAPAFVVAQEVIGAARRVSAVQIDNTANSTASYLKIWMGDPTGGGGGGVGAVPPDTTLMAPASTKIQYTFSPGFEMDETWVAVTSEAPVSAKSYPTGTITAQLMLEIP